MVNLLLKILEKNHGKKHSEDTRKKMSLARGTTIFVYSLQSELLYTFSSSRAAATQYLELLWRSYDNEVRSF